MYDMVRSHKVCSCFIWKNLHKCVCIHWYQDFAWVCMNRVVKHIVIHCIVIYCIALCCMVVYGIAALHLCLGMDCIALSCVVLSCVVTSFAFLPLSLQTTSFSTCWCHTSKCLAWFSYIQKVLKTTFSQFNYNCRPLSCWGAGFQIVWQFPPEKGYRCCQKKAHRVQRLGEGHAFLHLRGHHGP